MIAGRWPAKDGHIAIQPVSRAASAKFLELGGIPDAYESDRIRECAQGREGRRLLRDAARGGLAHTTEEWMELGQQHRIPIMRANTLDEVLDDPHLKAVDFFAAARAPDRGAVSRDAPAGEIFENARQHPPRSAAAG